MMTVEGKAGWNDEERSIAFILISLSAAPSDIAQAPYASRPALSRAFADSEEELGEFSGAFAKLPYKASIFVSPFRRW